MPVLEGAARKPPCWAGVAISARQQYFLVKNIGGRSSSALGNDSDVFESDLLDQNDRFNPRAMFRSESDYFDDMAVAQGFNSKVVAASFSIAAMLFGN